MNSGFWPGRRGLFDQRAGQCIRSGHAGLTSELVSPHVLLQGVVFLAFLLGSVVFIELTPFGIPTFLILGSLFLLCPTEVWMLLAFGVRVPLPGRDRRPVPLIRLLGLAGAVVAAQPSTLAFLDERPGLQGYDSGRLAPQIGALDSFLVQPFAIGPGVVEVKFDHLTRSRDTRTVAEDSVSRPALLVSFLGLRLWQALRSAWAGSVLHMLALSKLIGLLISSAVVDTLSWRHFWSGLAFCWFPVAFPGLRRSDWKLALSRADVFLPFWERA